jgi:hypothetical protein
VSSPRSSANDSPQMPVGIGFAKAMTEAPQWIGDAERRLSFARLGSG